MYLFLEAAAAAGTKFPIYFVAVYFIGFMAALVLGTIAWNASKNNPSRDKIPTPNKADENSAN